MVLDEGLVDLEAPSLKLNIDDLMTSCAPDQANPAQSIEKFFDWDTYCFDHINQNERAENDKILEQYLGG